MCPCTEKFSPESPSPLCPAAAVPSPMGTSYLPHDEPLELICERGMAQLRANFDVLLAGLTKNPETATPGTYPAQDVTLFPQHKHSPTGEDEDLEAICATGMAQHRANFDRLFKALSEG